MKPYRSYKDFLQERFGGRIQKLTINAGFTCPNRDGKVGVNGCSYCLNDAFNPSYCHPEKSVEQQLEEGIVFHQNRYRRAEGYLAYFQAYSNTYAPLEDLKRIYQPAMEHPLVKGIVIGTRPDCVDAEKLDYFAELNKTRFVSLEYGVESVRDETLLHINRGHDFACAKWAIEETAKREIHCGSHFIYGLPTETPEMWLEDIEVINQLPINSIKFHQLQIIKNTAMELEFQQHPERFHLFSIDNYIPFIVEIVKKLRKDIVIERFAGEVPPRFLALNTWGNIRYDVIL